MLSHFRRRCTQNAFEGTVVLDLVVLSCNGFLSSGRKRFQPAPFNSH